MTEQANTQTAIKPYERLKALALSDQMIKSFADAVGDDHARTYIRSVLIAVAQSDKLQTCDPISIMSSAMRAATLHLSCDPATKQAHLVPFGGKATLIIGYKGFYDMALRTHKYRYLNDFRVYEGEIVQEDRFKGIHILSGHRQSDKVIGYMLAFELKDGFAKSFYMTVEEIQEHGKRYSKTFNYNDSLWKTDFDKMARKTVIRLGLSKYGYLDPQDRMMIDELDESAGGMTIEGVSRDLPHELPSGRSEEQIIKELGFDPTKVTADPETGEVVSEGEQQTLI